MKYLFVFLVMLVAVTAVVQATRCKSAEDCKRACFERCDHPQIALCYDYQCYCGFY